MGDEGETRWRQVEDKWKLMRPKAPKCEGQVGDKCKIRPAKAPRVGDKCGKQAWPRVRDKCGKQVWETSGRQVETHAAQGTQSWRQVEDKCKLMQPKEPRVGDKCGKQVWETRCGPRHPEWQTSVGDKWKTSVNSCGRPRDATL